MLVYQELIKITFHGDEFHTKDIKFDHDKIGLNIFVKLDYHAIYISVHDYFVLFKPFICQSIKNRWQDLNTLKFL